MATFFPDIVDPDTLRVVARAGIEAAERAGATYADIRVGDLRTFGMVQSAMEVPFGWTNCECVYGLRVRVNGVWGFTFGADLTTDAIARAARSVVGTTRGIAQFAAPASELLPVPVVRGEWTAPVQIDPFTVSPNTYAEILGAYQEIAERIPDGWLETDHCLWTAETRAFASTEGSLITQHFVRAEPNVYVRVEPRFREPVTLAVPSFIPCSAGFEIMVGPERQEEVKATTEAAARLAGYPQSDAGIGRYDTVLDGMALSAVLGGALLRALEMECLTGAEVDGRGTSFLASMDGTLNNVVFAKNLTVTTERSLPHYSAARWDDEGVVTKPFTVIQQGRIVNYCTTRALAPELAAWYARQNRPLPSHGSAITWTPAMSPVGSAADLSVEAGKTGATLDTLLAPLSNGIIIHGMKDQSLSMDRQRAGGFFLPHMMYEVKRGRITRRLKNGAIQFNTKRLLTEITALGDASTCRTYPFVDVRGETWTRTMVPVTAPAAQIAQLDVVQLPRRR